MSSETQQPASRDVKLWMRCNITICGQTSSWANETSETSELSKITPMKLYEEKYYDMVPEVIQVPYCAKVALGREKKA